MTNRNGFNGGFGSGDSRGSRGRGAESNRGAQNFGDYDSDQTQEIGRVGSSQPADGHTRIESGRQAPRQYFPGEDGGAGYDDRSQGGRSYDDRSYDGRSYEDRSYDGRGAAGYGEPVPASYDPNPQPQKSSSALTGVFAAIAVLSLLTTGVLFFLWRNAAHEANKPAPAPSTVTQTTQVPTTVTTTEKSDPLPGDMREYLPSELPTEIPTEYLPGGGQGGQPGQGGGQSGQGGQPFDVEGFLNDLMEGNAPA